jgi:vacuolar-type H+-ATPase subunit D/Vma8
MGRGSLQLVWQPQNKHLRQALLLFLRRYAGGDSIKHTVFDNVDRATLKVYSSQENVAGVKIPKFESVSEPGETKMELTGAFEVCTAALMSGKKPPKAVAGACG